MLRALHNIRHDPQGVFFFASLRFNFSLFLIVGLQPRLPPTPRFANRKQKCGAVIQTPKTEELNPLLFPLRVLFLYLPSGVIWLHWLGSGLEIGISGG